MLAPGSRLGPYEIVSPLGAGGMGEVYRARDAKLGRDVAIKILPDAFVHDADRLARFEREARTLASLNHSNIAQIYGLEERALVMEFVDGEDLSALIARGPMPLADALPIARQIAQALEAAHELGIVHRDLKPANIKVRPDGTVKVLDFGLAKAMAADAGGVASLSDSPTTTSPATELGVILGTAAYMSPEQARGKPVDRRSDVWAFGVVLYEMLTGRRAFSGAEVPDVLASILKDTPSLDRLPADTPPAIRRLLQRCLVKDRTERLDSTAAARLEIADAMSGAPAPGHGAPPKGATLGAKLGVPIMAAITGGAIMGGAVWSLRKPTPVAAPSSFALASIEAGRLSANINQPDLAISPDGRLIAYSSAQTETSPIILRSLDAFGDRPLKNLGRQPRAPFFSPDGKWIGYFSAVSSGFDGRIMKVRIEGGAPIEIGSVVGNLRGASWGRDDTIIYASSALESGLFRLSANGGAPELLTVPNVKAGEVDHFWPCVLPDGKHVLFAIARQTPEIASGRFDVAALDLSTRTWRVLLTDASFPVYVPTGHLLVTSEKGLAVVRFDPIAVEIHGTPQPLIDDVFFKNTTGAADVSVSATGTLAYVSGRLSDSTTLIWTDRLGNASQVPIPPASFIALRLSPDGRRVALTQNDKGAPGIWVYDFERQTLMRVTPSGFPGFFPLWSESGRDIYFSGAPATETGIYSMPASGAGVPALVAAAPPGSRLVPSSVRPGSTEVVFEQWSGTGVRTIMVVKPGATPTVTPLFSDVARYALPAISPDGRWIAYSSDEGGRQELYLRPFPDVAADRIQVSTDGGRAPVWVKGGKELFYSSLDGAIWAASVGDPRSRDVGKPVRIPDPPAVGLRTPFDVAPDGQRVLRMVLEAPKETTNELRVVTNWFEVLKKKS